MLHENLESEDTGTITELVYMPMSLQTLKCSLDWYGKLQLWT